MRTYIMAANFIQYHNYIFKYGIRGSRYLFDRQQIRGLKYPVVIILDGHWLNKSYDAYFLDTLKSREPIILTGA